MRRLRSRRGQASSEYAMLLCSGVMAASIAGSLLQNKIGSMMEQITEQIVEAAIELARP